MTTLTPLEEDLLGDLSQDPHELWEIYPFVRLHRANATMIDIAIEGNALLSAWLRRGWLKAFKSRQDPYPLTTDRLLEIILKPEIIEANTEHGAILLELTDRAYHDVDWLER